ncbi:MAG TPA: pilus assembly PilX N-terminal domain-containing protein [Methylophilus sp.]|nr:pilus assembly PilX N-terminal domain-containing protein [Methylophilus sp.]
MKNNPSIQHIQLAQKQRGLVLFIALIALVAMSLAAAALVRSVDSGVLVAGNLAFKQSALMSAESGIAQAYRYINENPNVLEAGNGANGYYASFNSTLSTHDDMAWLKNDANWANAFTVPTDLDDTSQNVVEYIIQRMCTEENVPDTDKETKCMVGAGNARASSKGSKSEGGGSGGGGYDAAKGSKNVAVYRVTVKVTGPKNTISYLQAFLY